MMPEHVLIYHGYPVQARCKPFHGLYSVTSAGLPPPHRPLGTHRYNGVHPRGCKIRTFACESTHASPLSPVSRPQVGRVPAGWSNIMRDSPRPSHRLQCSDVGYTRRTGRCHRERRGRQSSSHAPHHRKISAPYTRYTKCTGSGVVDRDNPASLIPFIRALPSAHRY